MTAENAARIQNFVSKPLWARSPEQFFKSHQTVLALHLEEWPPAEPLVLSKFIAAYFDGLPEDLPAEILLQLTQQAIQFFEKNKAETPVLEPA